MDAIPILLARIGAVIDELIISANPIRAGGWNSLKAKGALPKFLELAATRGCDLVLLILDLDDGCAVEEHEAAMRIISEWLNGRTIVVEVVFLPKEYETLFLHDAVSRGNVNGITNPDSVRDAKGAMRTLIGRRYKETQDQLILTKALDIKEVYSRSRPFRRLCKALLGKPYSDINDIFT